MKKFLIFSLVFLVLLTILGWWSYSSTYRRTFGSLAPFVIDIQVLDAQGAGISGAKASLSSFPSALVESEPELSSADGQIMLIHRPSGVEWEYEERYLFWIIRIGDTPMAMFDGTLEVQADGYARAQTPLRDVFKQQNGSLTLSDRELPRYPVVITLKP